MESWFLFRSGLGASAFNMAVDESLLEHSADLKKPVLRFYGWNEPAATFGYFQRYSEVEKWTPLRPLIRRPTGGGLVPHNNDWTYSLVFPPGHLWYELRAPESYQRTHEWISAAFERLRVPTQLAAFCAKDLPGQCFVGAEKFDVLFQGRKIAGAAQRRNKLGLLIQGSVQSHPPNVSRDSWENAMCEIGGEKFGIQWADFKPSENFSKNVAHLQKEKYFRAEFNQRR